MSQELDFKPKHRPLSLARIVIEAESVAEIQQLRTMLAAPSNANSFLLHQHAYGMEHKMALRLHVLGLTTLAFMAGTMTTTALSAVG